MKRKQAGCRQADLFRVVHGDAVWRMTVLALVWLGLGGVSCDVWRRLWLVNLSRTAKMYWRR